MVNNGQTNLPLGTTTYNGGAASSQRAAELIQQATGGNGVLQQSTHPLDPVGGVVGGNPSTQSNGSLKWYNPLDWLNSHGSYEPNAYPEDANKAWGSGQRSQPSTQTKPADVPVYFGAP